MAAQSLPNFPTAAAPARRFQLPSACAQQRRRAAEARRAPRHLRSNLSGSNLRHVAFFDCFRSSCSALLTARSSVAVEYLLRLHFGVNVMSLTTHKLRYCLAWIPLNPLTSGDVSFTVLSTLTGPGRKWVVFGQILEPLSSILVNSPTHTSRTSHCGLQDQNRRFCHPSDLGE